ncbi:alpha-2,8-sialyltransferase 8F isoform X3 [Oncorhynchus mykiss]|uniref:alpha-2,8-sialyltransferase 8F isoform X3 n=2 Tax=Oncorhynchus mykiss TaxID=8022 RepID=UPI00187796D3|nr:alpha-2,8-sialyltransferase 8F isoform X3 [Oncorhynchus mykiss]
MCYLVLFILVCSGTLLSITLIDYYQHQRVDIGLFSQEVRDLMDCPWRLNLTHRELHRTELWSCCNAYDRLMVTRQNTNQNQSLTYEVERKRKRKVDQALWEMLPQTVPWSKGSLSRCAVVGSGGILQNSRCGAEIDNSDYVIRFNLAPINKSYDVGVKTDLITANPTQINKGYPGLQLNPGPLAEALSVYGHAHLLLPAFSFAFGTSPCFKVYQALRKARSQQKVVFFHPDYLFELGRFWRRRGQRAPRLSTGLMLASTALEICEQVFICMASGPSLWIYPKILCHIITMTVLVQVTSCTPCLKSSCCYYNSTARGRYSYMLDPVHPNRRIIGGRK